MRKGDREREVGGRERGGREREVRGRERGGERETKWREREIDDRIRERELGKQTEGEKQAEREKETGVERIKTDGKRERKD